MLDPTDRTLHDDERREPAAARLAAITALGATRTTRWIDRDRRALPAALRSATPAAQQHALRAKLDAELMARLGG